MARNNSLVDLLLELQRLDRVPRSGYLLRGITDAESVAEHNFHVLTLVFTLGPRVSGLDLLRALEIAFVHDLAEVRFGDLPRTAADYLPEGAKKIAEAAALEDLLAPLPKSQRERFAEYQAGETLEARFVKACDKLQLMLKVTHYEDAGQAGVRGFWDHPANFPAPGDGDDPLAVIGEVFEELRAWRQARRG